MNFLPVVAEEIPVQNILTKYGNWLNICLLYTSDAADE